jgi:hypothetical protein
MLNDKIFDGLFPDFTKFYFVNNFKKNGIYVEFHNIDYNVNNFHDNEYHGVYKENFGNNIWKKLECFYNDDNLEGESNFWDTYKNSKIQCFYKENKKVQNILYGKME